VTEPAYQRSLQSTSRRSTPDVAFDADPNTGVAVYTTTPSTGRGSWYQVGGTSLGALAWAAIIAIADQGRAATGLGSLDGATQTLPALYRLPSSDFHKPGGVTATGLGTPNGAALVNGLAFGVNATNSNASAVGTRAKAQNVVAASSPVVGGSGGQSGLGQGRSGTSNRRSSRTLAVGGEVVAGQTNLAYLSDLPRTRGVFDAALQELATELLRNA
jgi:hypothetical protein